MRRTSSSFLSLAALLLFPFHTLAQEPTKPDAPSQPAPPPAPIAPAPITPAPITPAPADPTPPPPPPAPSPPPTITEQLNAEAIALRPLVSTDLARAFLDATPSLPLPTSRTILRNKDRTRAYSQSHAANLSLEQLADLTEKTYDPSFYYLTGYGSPLVYARVVDILAHNGVTSLANKKLLDFGYGTIGHLRLLASLGCETHGVDVEPVFRALYSQPQDQGPVPGLNNAPAGSITLHSGQWPLERPLVRDIGRRYDIITSKNTLKRGYIHPSRPADPRTLVHLGVDDGTFLGRVYDALNPGGLFLIYNLSPAQAPADQPYIPWADGQSPFSRELLEWTGFEVIEFDHEDREPALDYWMALGINQGKSREDTGKDLFAWYTLCRKPENPLTPTPNR